MKTLLYPLMLSFLFSSHAIAASKAPLESRSTSLQCADRRIDIQAHCFQEDGIRGLSCTSQRLSVSAAAGAAPLSTRIFKPQAVQEGQDYPVVEEKIGAMVCTATPDRQQYIVTSVANGGNCDQCEWVDVYGWDGALIGSNRDPRKSKVVAAAIAAAFDTKAKKIGVGDATPLYVGSSRRGH